MKNLLLWVLFQLILSVVCCAEERTNYAAGIKHDLLSAAAAYAIEEDDILLLKQLRSSGWNPNLILGRMPGQNNSLRYTPLTFAALCEAKKSIAWLLDTCKVSLDARDSYNERAIDVAIGKKLRDDHPIFNLLKRDLQRKEKDALAELACLICDKSLDPMKLHHVNGGMPGTLWDQFDELLVKVRAETVLQNEEPAGLIPDKSNPEARQKKNDTSGAKASEPDNLNIQWNQIGEDTYEFKFSTSDQPMSGGGMSGRIYFKFGYWLCEIKKTWDS